MDSVQVDTSQLKEFFARMETAAKGDFKKEMALFLEGIGVEFLSIVQDEIIRLKAMEFRLLLASFKKGTRNNTWVLKEGDLILEVGTNLEYAKYVNDGHWTNKPGVLVRFVPGFKYGDTFIYDPSSKTGISIKQKWVEGKPYWNNALDALNKIFPELLDKKLQMWLDKYFSM